MDKALYVAMTGAKNNMLAQVNHANNLANINTTGFKTQFTQARSMPVFFGEGQPSRAYAMSENHGINFTVGALMQTGQDLDIAIEREGFIAVQAPDGQESYTRSGSLRTDAQGVLRNGNGLPVIGNGGPIAIPPAEKIDIGIDGSITIIPVGQGPQETALVDRIRLVNPPTDTLYKTDDGLFRSKDPQQDIPGDGGVTLVSGFLESSNVSAVNELINVLSLSRQYEMQVKLMQSVKENSESSARLLQNS